MRVDWLTPEEATLIPEFVDKWAAIGLSTVPIDHRRAERALSQLYAWAGLIEPKIAWAPCPMTAMLAAIVYTKIRVSGQEGKARDDKVLAQITERITQRALIGSAARSVHRRMHIAVECAVTTALSLTSRLWTGFDPALAINQARRAAFDRVLNRRLDDRVHKRLQTVLVMPIRSGVAEASGVLQPALNLVLYGGLGPRARRAGLAYSGSPFWVPYAAKLDYARRVLGIPLERPFIEALESCGLFWMLDGICFAAERPSHINRDETGHLHCEVGPALAYPSGWSWWHWHGVRVPQSVIEEPERITVESIKQVRSGILRRVMIGRYRHDEPTHGIAAYLRDAGGIRLDQDPAGTLWGLAVAGEPTLMVEVVNHSPEPDGVYRHFFLQAHPELRPILPDGTYGAPQSLTAGNAVAASFGLTGAEYAPEVET